MTTQTREKRDDYYAKAGSWADERTRSIDASRKIAWIVAMVATAVALLLAITVFFMMPLKTVVPHTLLVDTYAWAMWAYRLILFTGIAVMVYQQFFKALGIVLFLDRKSVV